MPAYNEPNKWESFNREFWKLHNHDDANGPVALHWYDKTGIYNLDKHRIVEITLSDPRIANHYLGYDVRIVHKNNGEIARHFFNFNDYLDNCPEERADNRVEYTGPYYVWLHHGELGWYIAKPGFDTIVDMQSCIIGWISQYE